MTKQFKVSMLVEKEINEFLRCAHEVFFITLGSSANRFDVRQEIIRQGYKGEILSIEELKYEVKEA